MSDRFAGKTAIVTGASRGIGFAIADRLVADGARVVITARQQDALDQAVAALGGPERALAVAGKADDIDHQADTVKRAVDTFGSVVAGIRPAPGIGFYGATKAMLTHITQELAVELGPDIRVNAVAPAVVKTKFATALYEGREDSVAATYPLKRLGVPGDIAGAVAFLLSADAAWLTGQLLVLDGGVTLTGGV